MSSLLPPPFIATRAPELPHSTHDSLPGYFRMASTLARPLKSSVSLRKSDTIRSARSRAWISAYPFDIIARLCDGAVCAQLSSSKMFEITTIFGVFGHLVCTSTIPTLVCEKVVQASESMVPTGGKVSQVPPHTGIVISLSNTSCHVFNWCPAWVRFWLRGPCFRLIAWATCTCAGSSHTRTQSTAASPHSLRLGQDSRFWLTSAPEACKQQFETSPCLKRDLSYFLRRKSVDADASCHTTCKFVSPAEVQKLKVNNNYHA